MTDRELISQLHKLKNITPDHQWKKDNRDILLSQIGSGEAIETEKSFSIFSYIFAFERLEWVTQPVGVMAMIILLLGGGSFYSVYASRNAVPGDSLYIAKIVSEKTKQAITFNEKDKAVLGIEFATNRAKEMAEVAAQNQDGDKAQQLESDFKKEIQAVKSRLSKITPNAATSNTDDSEQVFSADSGKDGAGIQVSNNSTIQDTAVKETPTSSVLSNAESTSTASAASDTVSTKQTSDPKTALDEAEKLFEQKDYSGTVSKLEEASGIISNTSGAATESPAATSTN